MTCIVRVRNLNAVPQKYLFRSLLTKNTENFVLGIFLSKPQAWYIIRRKSVYHQGRVAPLYLITRQRAFFLRLDDIQTFGLMIYRNKLRMIYKATP